MPQAQTYQSEFTGLEMDARFAAVAQLTAALEALTTVVAQKYVKPASGIPSTDMDADVQAALAKANTAVQSLADYYTKSEVDQLLAAINGMEYVDVATLPTASANTLGKIYLVGPDASGYYSYYYTSYDGSAYSWVGPLGTTQISLANYATKDELSQLEAKVDEISKTEAADTGEEIKVVSEDGQTTILEITENGVDAKNLKSNGTPVLTEHQDISGLATKEEVYPKISDIEVEPTFGDEDEIVIETAGGVPVANIKESGADFKNLKSNGVPVSTGIDPEINAKVASNTGRLNSVENDLSALTSRGVGGYAFASSQILSEVFDGHNIFIVKDKQMKNWSSTTDTGYNSTSFVNIDKVTLIEFMGLRPKDGTNAPIYLYDSSFQQVAIAEIEESETISGAFKCDLGEYPTAYYAVFNDNGNAVEPIIKMYVATEQAKNGRKVLVGCYYFAGWSETTFPNIHNTEELINGDRVSVFGPLDDGSFKGEGWLVSPDIQLNSGTSSITLTNSCIFNDNGNCAVFMREAGGVWEKVADMPIVKPYVVETADTEIAIPAKYAGKMVNIGFCISNKNGELSAVWTINALEVTSNGTIVFSRDYTDHSNLDMQISDTDVWSPAKETMAYNGTNGYVGSLYNQHDASIIDKQILLAKSKGIDYFMLEWFYHDDQSTLNVEAIHNEVNHIGINAMMKSLQKLGFKFALMVTNHSPFRIVGLENWKAAFRYLKNTYFDDPSYLIVNNKPVFYIFDKSDFRDHSADLEQFFISELGYDGMYVLYTNYNTVPNSGELVARDISDLYDASKNWNINAYTGGNYRYNFVTNITCGWDSHPWFLRPSPYARPTDWFVPDIEKWKEMLKWAFDFSKAYNNGIFRSMLICAFNELGEGSYLLPTIGDRRGEMICALNDVKQLKTI